MPAADSPTFWQSFRQRRGAMIGLVFVGLLFVVAMYGPFLSGTVALLWWDDAGIAFPILGDLFNKGSYPYIHDLAFNILALLLPVVVLAKLIVRRGSSLLWFGSLAAFIAFVLLSALLPLTPSGSWWRGSVQDARGQTVLSLLPERGPSTETESAGNAGNLANTEGSKLVRTPDGRIARVLPEETDHPDGTLVQYLNFPKRERVVGATPFELHVALMPLVATRYDRSWEGQAVVPPGTMSTDGSVRFYLGTDPGGRDILSLLIFGARVSLVVGLVVTGVAMSIGILLGSISGYFGGWVDLVIQRVVEIMMNFPVLILLLVVIAALGRNIFMLMIVMGLVGWPGTTRLVRGEFLGQMGREYVLAGKVLGLSHWRIMLRHVLPNTMTPILISATFSIAGAVLTESMLAFLGLGDPRVPSWGTILAEGRRLVNSKWLIYAPGLLIFILVMSLNLIGNGMRQVLDPQGGDDA